MIERAETTKAVKCIALTYICDNCGKREVVATMDENTSPDRRKQIEGRTPMPDGEWRVISVGYLRGLGDPIPVAHFCPECVDRWSIRLASGDKGYIIVGDDVRDALKSTMPLWYWNRSRPCHTACVAFTIEPHSGDGGKGFKVACCNAMVQGEPPIWRPVIGKLREEVRREANRQE